MGVILLLLLTNGTLLFLGPNEYFRDISFVNSQRRTCEIKDRLGCDYVR